MDVTPSQPRPIVNICRTSITLPRGQSPSSPPMLTAASSSPATRPSIRPAAHPARRLSNDEILKMLIESPEHHALCEAIIGTHDNDRARSSSEYRAFVDLAARLEAQKKPAPLTPAAESKREWNALWW